MLLSDRSQPHGTRSGLIAFTGDVWERLGTSGAMQTEGRPEQWGVSAEGCSALLEVS